MYINLVHRLIINHACLTTHLLLNLIFTYMSVFIVAHLSSRESNCADWAPTNKIGPIGVTHGDPLSLLFTSLLEICHIMSRGLEEITG